MHDDDAFKSERAGSTPTGSSRRGSADQAATHEPPSQKNPSRQGGFSPHLHSPFAQTLTVPSFVHGFWHAPQLLKFVSRSTQLPEQQVKPWPQALPVVPQTQALLTHWSALTLHFCPQPPQLPKLVVVSMHSASQQLVLCGQASPLPQRHSPLMQASALLAGQVAPQAPQLARLSVRH